MRWIQQCVLATTALSATVLAAEPVVAAPTHAQATAQATAPEATGDLLVRFEQLHMGMSTAEVLRTMGTQPQRQDRSVYLGLEMLRLVWTDPFTGSVFQAVLVAGRMVRQHSNAYPLVT